MNTREPNFSRSEAPGLQVELGAKSTRPLATRWLVLLVASVTVITGTAVWLNAQPRASTGTFGPTGANPATIAVNSPTAVTFTSQITDRQLKKRSVILLRLNASGQPSEIVGRLRDDGQNDDAQANDNIYTFRTTFNEPNIGKIGFRVAARFKPGVWREPEADDDDWDRELGQLTADRTTRRDRLARLLLRLGRYSLSNVFYVTVAEPRITWSQSELEVILSPGETTTRDLTFTSDLNIQNVAIEPVPALAPFVTIQPNKFANVPAGQQQSVRLNVSIPPGTTFGTYDGTVHVRLGSRTLPPTLRVKIDVWQFFESTLGFSLRYPAQWYLSAETEGVDLYEPEIQSRLSNAQHYTPPTLSVRVQPNPLGLTVTQFAASIDEGWFTRYTENRSLTIGKHNGILFSDVSAISSREPALAAFVAVGDRVYMVFGARHSESTFMAVLRGIGVD